MPIFYRDFNTSATPAGPHAIFCAGVAGVVFLYTALEIWLRRYKLTFKILTEIEKVDKEQFFEFSDTGYHLRGHSKRLSVNRCRLDSRKYFFSNSGASLEWLTQQVVDAQSVNAFTNRLDHHWKIWAFKEYSSQPIIHQVSSIVNHA